MIDEETAPNPVTPYARSKIMSEQDLLKLVGDDFCPVFLRAATAYGVSPYLRFDLALNNLVAWAYTTKQVYLKSDGMSWRPLVHIRDIARGYMTLLDAPKEKVCARAFNIGNSEENYRIVSLAELVRDGVPGSTLTHADDASPDKRSYRVSCDLIKRTLPEYQTTWTAARGIDEVYQVVRGSGLDAKDFEGERYNRIAHVRSLIEGDKLSTSLRWTEPAMLDPVLVDQ